ncbi:dUTP diphosphatase [Brevibacillus laterosporus]|uniref:dUTP diphosphatase n=1 Tax=Brevibacillus laterosporus TaxID=1465 RepID=UPI003D21F894
MSPKPQILVANGRYYDLELKEEYVVIETSRAKVKVKVRFEKDGKTAWMDYDDYLADAVPLNDIALNYSNSNTTLDVKVKILHDDAIIPKYQTAGAAGFDLHITEDITIPANRIQFDYFGDPDDPIDRSNFSKYQLSLTNNNHGVVGTGLAFEIPIGYELEIRGRSGNAFKYRVFAYNGTSDSDYRGEVKLLITNLGDTDITFKKGDRVAQGIIKKIEQALFTEVDELSSTERGNSGFGHTGAK